MAIAINDIAAKISGRGNREKNMVVVIVNVNDYRTETFEYVTSVSVNGNVLDIVSDDEQYQKSFVLTAIESYEVYGKAKNKHAYNMRIKRLEEERKLSEGML